MFTGTVGIIVAVALIVVVAVVFILCIRDELK